MCLNWHPREKLWAFKFLESFHCSILSVSPYYWPKSDIQVESYGRLNLPCASLFNLEHLDILCALSNIRVKSYGCLNLPCASMFNSEHLDILCIWIRHPSERLWAYEFLKSFHCSISSISIYYWPESDIRVKSYGPLIFSLHLHV